MIIEKNSVVKLNYSLYDQSGSLLDSSDENGSLIYIHGYNTMMPGIEKIVEGKEKGFTYKGNIEPEDAYGEYDPENVVPIPKDQFANIIDKMEEGETYDFEVGHGQTQTMTVVTIDDEFVTLDANHPYAGEKLTIECSIESVRPASQEEIDELNSHSCGCGGCGSSHEHDEDHECGCSSGDSDSECCGGKKHGSDGGCGCKH